MTVRSDVFMPKMKSSFDPKAPAAPTKILDWEKKAAEMEAQKKYEVEKNELDKLKNPPPKEPDNGFKITGGIDVGHIDLMQMQKEAQQKAIEIQQKYEDQLSQINQQSETYREQVHELQLKTLSDKFQVQTDALLAQIKLTQGQQPLSLIQQVAQIKEMASMLGLQAPAASITDSSLQIQMLKMQNDAAREQREFEWKMKQDEFARQAKIEEIKASTQVAMQKVQVERERNGMLAGAFDAIGSAIARGLMSGGTGLAPEVEMPIAQQPQPVAGVAAPSPSPKQRAIEAGEGDSGEIECPDCRGSIIIAPTTTEGVCSNCGLRIPVRRVASSVKS